MKIQKFENKEDWLQARKGKITGTRLKDIVVLRGNTPKIGFFQLIAERLAIPADDENPMERGLRLEGEAIARFEKETGKKVNTDLVLLTRNDNESIAYSPDGYMGKVEAVEAKCLSSAHHLEAWYYNVVQKDYQMQTIQPFIVNPSLKKLYVVFYDPRIPAKDYFVIEVLRGDVKKEIDEYLEYQRKTLEEVEKIVLELTNF